MNFYNFSNDLQKDTESRLPLLNSRSHYCYETAELNEKAKYIGYIITKENRLTNESNLEGLIAMTSATDNIFDLLLIQCYEELLLCCFTITIQRVDGIIVSK